jgi:hypothetical protein
MNKIFGYTKRGGKDWFVSDPYSDREIEDIKDPEGGGELSLPTAIPSPFARIDLVKTAFTNIVKTPELKAHSKNGTVVASKSDEKLVSDCLDLAELLFNYNSVREKLNIIIWDKASELANLKKTSDKHRRFAETLELYLDQDKDSYNFDLLDRLYLIEYDYRIIGCTSPVTLFFATANDLTKAQIRLAGSDLLFDDHYVPLYERDTEFQRYLYLLFEANPSLYSKMKDFGDYLVENKKILDRTDQTLHSELNKLNPEDYKNLYADLSAENANTMIEVLGVKLRKRKSEDVPDYISTHSDFRIDSTKFTGAQRPLVLHSNFSNADWQYAKDKWKQVPVPVLEETSMDKRKLPGINILYPYLTISDFLEPFLIRLVYPVNKDKFFDGNLITEVGDDSKGYILPLKRQFFDYFNADDLVNSGSGKPTIKIIQGVANSVKVVLKIPVTKQGEFITFERMYLEGPSNQISKPDETNNKGSIVEHQVGLAVFPFIKTNNKDIPPYYRIQLIDRDIAGDLKNSEYDLNFFSNTAENAIPVAAKKTRSQKAPPAGATSQYYVLNDEFDVIQIKNLNGSGASGVIIPRWQPYTQGSDVFSFAVDFGTTNTHIEYKIGGQSPKPFDITPNDIQIATLFHPTKTDITFGGANAIGELIEHEFVPHLVGNSSEYKFPQRTVIAHSHSLDINTDTFALADFNIPFTYEKKLEKGKIIPNLKWAKREHGNQIRVERFLENIVMLLRNKVLLNNGNLSATNLVWFYPSSMKPVRRAGLQAMWERLFLKYFNTAVSPIRITESLAPFYYFKGVNKLQGGQVISIDIGGGTTDVVIFKSKKPLLLTSFKFAANTLFGDGFSEFGAANNNGFANKYIPHFETLLGANKLYDLTMVLSSIKDKNITEDINAFFFSIENNPKIGNKELFSYNTLLSNDEDLKILFLYFYSAIIYHIAKLMKIKGLDLPNHLVFSGTGSKILTIITPDLKTTLADFSMKIFEGVYGQKFNSEGLTIETDRQIPKEVTCKGGLMSNAEDLNFDINQIKTILTCLEDKGVTDLTLDRLDDAAKNDIVKYVTDFNNFFLELNKELSFNKNFDVSSESLDVFKRELNKYLGNYLTEGLEHNRKLDEVDENEIEETLFFYPIIGTINNLSNQLAALHPVDK